MIMPRCVKPTNTHLPESWLVSNNMRKHNEESRLDAVPVSRFKKGRGAYWVWELSFYLNSAKQNMNAVTATLSEYILSFQTTDIEDPMISYS